MGLRLPAERDPRRCAPGKGPASLRSAAAGCARQGPAFGWGRLRFAPAGHRASLGGSAARTQCFAFGEVFQALRAWEGTRLAALGGGELRPPEPGLRPGPPPLRSGGAPRFARWVR
ncbi:hypothetical protein Sros01_83740 [Streptomyces roseochromogenus]|nr:hypothetical protein Sros01_83740 [Streptomyces roseochromogenus]